MAERERSRHTRLTPAERAARDCRLYASGMSTSASLTSSSVDDLLELIAARRPVPGGGAVAAISAALGVALGAMVLGYSLGAKRAAGREAELEDALAQFARARAALTQLADEDGAAYAALSAALGLPRNDPARRGLTSSAALDAIRPPEAVLGVCAHVLGVLETLAPITNCQLASDLRAAAVLLDAAGRAAECMIDANLPLIADGVVRGDIHARAAGLTGACRARAGGLLAPAAT